MASSNKRRAEEQAQSATTNKKLIQRKFKGLFFCFVSPFILTACMSDKPPIVSTATITITPLPTVTITPTPTPTPTIPSTPIPPPISHSQKCSTPSPADFVLDGDYDISWTIGGGRYEGILRMSKDSGTMVIKSPTTDGSVIQDMKLRNCTFGLTIAGYNPRRPKGDNRDLNYSADNLVLRIETDNKTIRMLNIDDRGVSAPIELNPRK